jgi:CRP-like cAMP-binding protein
VIKNLKEVISGNRLLNAFGSESRERVGPYIETVKRKLGDTVCEAGGRLDHAYFPDGGVLSLLTVLQNGSAIETAMIGREGAFGLGAAMSKYGGTSFTRSIVQMEGCLLRIPAEVLRSEFAHSAHIRNLFGNYTGTLLTQIQQTVACNALHSVRQKISRWLLMMHDRIEGDDLPYTHEFLSQMLGINRKSVTLAAQRLQTKGFINYRRGKIQILDRPGLERVSCECYSVVKARFDEFLALPLDAGAYAGKRIE